MAKNMARIEDGVVVNIEWQSESTVDTETLVSCRDIPVDVGDTYEEGVFYRDGVRVLSPMEATMLRLEDAENALAILLGGAIE